MVLRNEAACVRRCWAALHVYQLHVWQVFKQRNTVQPNLDQVGSTSWPR
jgi:hypothetical protein